MVERNTALTMKDLLPKAQQWAQSLGFQQLGVSDIDLSQAEAQLASWLKAGFHGEMKYMERHGTPKSPEDLAQHKMITYSYLKQPNVFGYTDQNKQAQQVQLNSRVQTNDSELELFLCVAGQGIVRLPHFILNDELETGQLVELFSDIEKQYIDVHIIYPSRKHMSSKVRRFIDFVISEMKVEEVREDGLS